MKAPMLKRRLNPFLLAATVLVLSLLAGLSVMYQGQLSNVLSDKKELQQELDQKNQRIASLQQENANLSKDLRIARSDQQQTQKLLDNAEQDIRSLNSTIEELRGDIDEQEDRIATLNTRINELQLNITDLRLTVNDLNGSIAELCEADFDLNGTEEDTYVEACEEHGHGDP